MDRFSSISNLDVSDEHPIRIIDRLWLDQAATTRLVPWSVFVPMKMVSVLPWVLLLDCLPDEEYRYRLCGSGCENLLGMNLTGQLFGENVNKKWANKSKEEFNQIKQGKGPFYSKGNVPILERDFMKMHRAVYGFSVQGGEIDRILAVVAPTEKYWQNIGL